jgi:hypothetical protein
VARAATAQQPLHMNCTCADVVLNLRQLKAVLVCGRHQSQHVRSVLYSRWFAAQQQSWWWGRASLPAKAAWMVSTCSLLQKVVIKPDACMQHMYFVEA